MNTEVKCSIIEVASNEPLYQIEVHNSLIPAYIVKKHDGLIPYIHTATQNCFFSSVVADLALRLGPDGERSGKSCTKRMKHCGFK